MTSDFFFEKLPEFYAKRDLGGCKAGKNMLHVDPRGMVQPCAELEPVAHYTQFVPRKYPGSNCGKCFDACRAEPQAPLTPRRLGELFGVL
jgi:MoaA/NifB/PqqE/SkfB family radical SAM enzyme